jgi:dTDP-4-amino-4,6-dideoxygalactose transaminase
MKIRLSSPCVGEKELRAVERVFSSQHLAMSCEVFSFEEELRHFIGNDVRCVSSCTDALLLALQAIDIKEGDEVLAPSITYVATFQAITGARGTPVVCDVDPKTGLLDINDAKARITKNTKAIIYVHYASQFSSRKEVYELAKAHNLRVIEDAAHSFGSFEGSNRIGHDGDITCFSFDNIKNITCGDGGAIVTSDQEVLKHVEDARLLSVEGDTQKRIKRERSVVFDVKTQGWRFHMNDISAAIGRVQLERFEELHQKRSKIVNYYLNHLPKDIVLPLAPDSSLHIFPIHVDKRDEVAEKLLELGIQVGKHYYPNHLLSFFKTDYGLPGAESFFKKILILPLHPNMEEEEAAYVAKNLLSIL